MHEVIPYDPPPRAFTILHLCLHNISSLLGKCCLVRTVIHIFCVFFVGGIRGIAFNCQICALHFIRIATHTTVYIDLWIPLKKMLICTYVWDIKSYFFPKNTLDLFVFIY